MAEALAARPLRRPPGGRATHPPTARAATSVVLVLVVAYGLTLMRGVGGPTDTAKFQYLGTVLGTAHQPGYPSYTALLALAVRVVPFASDAVVANGLSALATVVAAVLVCRLLVVMGVRPALAAGAAILLGLTRTIWSQAVIAEVYGLHLLLMLGVLLALTTWVGSRDPRHLVTALAVWAFSFSHATSAVLLAPAVLGVVLAVDRRAVFRRRVITRLPLFAALALVPYAYIYWRTLAPGTPYLEASFTSPAQFVDMVRGSDFSGQMFAFSWSEMVTGRLALMWGEVAAQPLAWAVVPAAAAVVLRRRDPRTWLLVVAGATTAVWGMGYDIPDVEVVFVLEHACLVALAAVGVEEVLRRSSQRVATAVCVVLVLLAPALVAASNARAVLDGSRASGARVVDALDAVGPEGGVMFSPEFHTLNYYLIGQGQQDRRGVYAPYPARLDVVSTYCRRGFIGLGSNQTVPHVPRGLPIYAFGQDYVDEIEDHGDDLGVERLGGGLARITCGVAPQGS